MTTGEYVEVYLAEGLLAGEMIKNLLEASGIHALLQQESAGATYGLTVGPLGLVHVLVPESEADDAESILQAMENGELEAESSDTDEIIEGEIIDDDETSS